MLLIHYLILIPLAILGGIYFGIKIKTMFSFQNNNFLIYYWIFILTFFLMATLLLSPVAIFLLYSCGGMLLFDLVAFLFQKLNCLKIAQGVKKLAFHQIVPLLFSFIFTVWGLFNAMHPVLNTVSITIAKPMEPLKIILLSDLHLGTGTNQDNLDQIVQTVNENNIDLFVLSGDIFDERTSDELKEALYQKFRNIKTTYGTYFVEGNHDLLTDEVKAKYADSNITVLEDESLFVADHFYLIGRKDRTDHPLKMEVLMNDVNRDYPILLIDHQPSSSEEAKEQGIDLQLSGHTHAGQLFPINFFLKHGTYQTGNYHLVVSNGYGNWGIPVRTSSQNELVLINVTGINEKGLN